MARWHLVAHLGLSILTLLFFNLQVVAVDVVGKIEASFFLDETMQKLKITGRIQRISQLSLLLFLLGPASPAATTRNSESHTQELASILEVSVTMIEERRYAQAVDLLTNVSTSYPSSKFVPYNLGCALQSLGEFKRAAVAYQQALELDVHYEKARFNLAVVLRALGRIEEAVVTYKRVLKQNSQHDGAWFNLGSILLEEKRFHEAVDAYLHVVSLDPKNANAYDKLAFALNEIGEFHVAARFLKTAIQLQPRDSNYRLRLAYSNERMGRLQASLQQYRQVAEQNPKNQFAVKGVKRVRAALLKQRLHRGTSSGQLI